MGGSVYATKKNIESLVVASKEIGLEGNVDKTNYMVISREQNAGRSHHIKTDNSSFEKVKGFKYLGRRLAKQNSIQDKIKSGLNQEMVAIILCRLFCFPLCCPKI